MWGLILMSLVLSMLRLGYLEYWRYCQLSHIEVVILFANHKANGAVTNIGLSS